MPFEEDAISQDWVPRDARGLTASVLGSSSHEFPSVALGTRLENSELTAADRRLATEMVCGIIRRSATLDAVLAAHLSRPLASLEPGLQLLLRMGAYQLVFLDSVPPHAAVHETVELAKQLNMPRWSGLLNGVLRAIDRSLLSESTDAPGTDAIPLKPGVFRKTRKPIFPSPAQQRVEYLAQAYSFPQWLLERWAGRWQTHELTQVLEWFNSVAPFHLRVNQLRADRETLISKLNQAGIGAVNGSIAPAIRLEGSIRVADLPGFSDGLFTIQDETAMHASLTLAPQPGERVLDLCAAPGTKTTHLAELMGNQGQVIATDINANRLSSINEAAARLGISIVESIPIDHDGSGLPDGPFDAILVDAPCSNTGVLGKRPEARWRLKLTDIAELAAIQRNLLQLAVSRLRAGGRLLYSTCSIETDENEAVVQACMSLGLEVASATAFVPGAPSDGGFVALMRKGS